ncbi:hypothetical protein SLA2020_515240 [Shorea laevis]
MLILRHLIVSRVVRRRIHYVKPRCLASTRMLSFRISNGNNNVHLDNRISRLLRLSISSSSAALVPTERNHKKAQDENAMAWGFVKPVTEKEPTEKPAIFQKRGMILRLSL